MSKIIAWLMNPPTDGPKSILILRLMAGGVFFWEGLLKFVYANQGVGRFTKLGMPFPHFTATFVGGLEIGGGLLLLDHAADCDPVCGRDDRRDSVDENFDVSRESPLPLPPALPQVGFWAALHEVRSEYAQMLTALFLMLNGPGAWSRDAVLRKRRKWAVAQLVAMPIVLDLPAPASR